MSTNGIPLIALQNRPAYLDPMDSYQKMAELQQRLRAGDLDAQAKQLELQKTRMGLQQVQSMNEAFQSALRPSPKQMPTASGNPTPIFDPSRIYQSLGAAGQGSLIPGLQKHFVELDKTAGEVQKAKDEHNAAALDYFGAAAKVVADANYDPVVMGTVLAHAAANGYGQEANQLLRIT